MTMAKRQFKSYYVVWKLFYYPMNDEGEKCLNRTMQYGNQTAAQKALQNSQSLNRTMQYGN